MIKTELQFLLKYPDFNKVKKHNFMGNIYYKNYVYNIQLYLPHFPTMEKFEYMLFHGLCECKLKPFDYKINIGYFLENFSKYLDYIDDIEHNYSIQNKIEILEQICELETIKNCKIFTNQQNDLVKFENFVNYDGHFLKLEIKNNNNVEINVLQHSLPEIQINEIENELQPLFNPSSTLLDYYNQFIKLLENFELFYKYLNVIDELCFVCAPFKPTTKDNWRLFKLDEEKCFIKTSLNPFLPNSVQVKLYGPTSIVQKYREMYHENASKWNTEIDVYNNLLKTFDVMYFPMKPDDQMDVDDDCGEACNICLSYDLDGHIPICSCDNLRCGLVFHVFCLKKWFTSCTDGKSFLSVAIGSCPFCKQKLSTSFQSLLEEI